MSNDTTSGKEGGESNDELRARWQGANYRLECARRDFDTPNPNPNPGAVR